jgi:hypothetical protein
MSLCSLASRTLLVFLAASWIALKPTVAHEIRPAIVTVSFAGETRYEITVVANLEALLAGIGPQHADTDDAPSALVYNELRALPASELKTRFEAFAPKWLGQIKLSFDGARATPRLTGLEVPAPGDLSLARLSTVRLAGEVPSGAKDLTWSYPEAFGSSVLRVTQRDSGALVTDWLPAGRVSESVPLSSAVPKSTARLFADYFELGFIHILPDGLDHILFVLGLYLLSTHFKPLLVQVTAFTVAHSITLGLGLYGVIQLSPAIVEPLISLSIVYVAVENIVTTRLHPWRPAIVFGFGLLHGLGFAGVLQEIGLPRADFVTGLIGFNVGVEFGQLAVIALAWLSTGFWFSTRSWYRARIVQPASAAIALMGLYWTVERVFLG